MSFIGAGTGYWPTMRVVVTGASGNVGTSLLEVLVADPAISSVAGLARRVGRAMPFPQVEWVAGDVATHPLTELFSNADAVVHLAWAIQPSHDEARLWRTNVMGTRRVVEAAAAAGVPRLVYASSVGAYSPAPYEPRVDETHPTDGVATSFYSRHKATVEWYIDRFEEANRDMAVARVRPALIFKREAASGIRRLFLGRFFPGGVFRRGALPALPLPRELRFQAVHSSDVARACRALLPTAQRGAFNLAAEPTLDSARVAEMLGTRLAAVPTGLVRSLVAATWRLHSQPTPEGWLDMATSVPLMDSSRARRELGWAPRVDAVTALEHLFEGLVEKASLPTPSLGTWGSPVPRSMT